MAHGQPEKNTASGLANIGSRVYSWIWRESKPEHPRWLVPVNAFARILLIVIEEMRHNTIALRARGLTLMVFISIIPMLALGTAVVKGVGDEEQSRLKVYSLFDKLIAFESAQEPQSRGSAPGGTRGGRVSQDEQSTKSLAREALSLHLRSAVDKVFNYVDRTNFATLGLAGILGIIIIVIPFFSSLEQSMNTIWQVEKGRPLGLKILNYLAVMILLPIAINVGLAAMTVLESPSLLARLKAILPGSWTVPLLLKMIPVAVVVLTFTALYRALPNTKVSSWPAFVGGLVGGVAWLLVQVLYLKLQFGMARYNAIYGSFATIPLFLLWIYVGCIIFFAGAELSFAVKSWQIYLPRSAMLATGARLAMCIDVLAAVSEKFREKRVADRESLSHRLKQPQNLVGSALRDLLEAGFIRHVEGKESGYVPAGPVEEIDMSGLISKVYGEAVPDSAGGRLAEEALDAARSVLTGGNITDLLDRTGKQDESEPVRPQGGPES